MRNTTFGIIRLLLLLAFLLPGLVPVTQVGAEDGVWVEIMATNLNVREGPGVSFATVGALSSGSRAEVLGVHPETGWLEVAYEEGADGKGWISGSDKYVTVHGSLADVLQIVDVPNSSEEPSSSARADTEVAVASDPELQGTLVFQTSSGGDIYIVNANGTGLRKLTTGLDPALSPDGTDRQPFLAETLQDITFDYQSVDERIVSWSQSIG